jgi:hypothetical protein
MNFLESMVAQWYGYCGYFVRSNVHILPLKHGGYGAELDVLAFSPKDGELIHVEASSDALVWRERERRMRKKFKLPHEEYEKVFKVKVEKVRKIAICGFSLTSDGRHWGDIEVVTVREFIRTIHEALAQINPMKQAVPENYPLLRAVQMTAWATKVSTSNRRRQAS